METLLNNKKFINISIIFVAILSLFALAKFINEVKSSSYIGQNAQSPSIISVSGTGHVMATSDIATLSMTLSKDGATTKEAQDLLNASVTKTLDYLKTQKIDDKDIKSEYGGLSPKYSYSNNVVCMSYPCPPQQDAKIIGYTATQSITVKVRQMDNANEVRTGLANIGVTDITGPTFSIDNEEGLKDQARAIAIDDAKAKAKVLAGELGVRLVKITNFSDNTGGPIMYAAKAMDSSAIASAPAPTLPTGQNKITSNVTITYEIR